MGDPMIKEAFIAGWKIGFVDGVHRPISKEDGAEKAWSDYCDARAQSATTALKKARETMGEKCHQCGEPATNWARDFRRVANYATGCWDVFPVEGPPFAGCDLHPAESRITGDFHG